jgi:nitrite reductase/ring-hydroxylating ferredoxin subunit
MADDNWVPLCPATALVERGSAVPFDIVYAGQTCRAFAIRFNEQPYAYVNRCTHVAMELDWQPNRIFDASGQWLLCASHGAAYAPDSGACAGGPCRGGLVRIELSEKSAVVYWHAAYNLRPVLPG